MKGWTIRLHLYMKQWLRSLTMLLIFLSLPVSFIVFYQSGSFTVPELASFLYEKLVPVWFIFIVQWCLAIDIDSKFIHHLFTYPFARKFYLFERLLFAIIIFGSLLGVITGGFSIVYGSFMWKGLFFSLPIYISMVGFEFLGTVIARHTLGGMIAGLFFWSFYLLGGRFLKGGNAILLIYQDVERFLTGEYPFWSEINYWIIFNRIGYFAVGFSLTLLAVFIMKKRSP